MNYLLTPEQLQTLSFESLIRFDHVTKIRVDAEFLRRRKLSPCQACKDEPLHTCKKCHYTGIDGYEDAYMKSKKIVDEELYRLVNAVKKQEDKKHDDIAEL